METVLNQGVKELKGPSIFNFLRRIGVYPALHFYKLMKEYGDNVKCSSFFYVIGNPDLARKILNRDQKDFNQDDFIGKRTKAVFGKGLVTSQGELWVSQRKLLNPVFSYQGVHQLINDADEQIDVELDRWNGKFNQGKPFDLVDEMGTISIMVAGKILFNVDFKNQLEEIKKVVKKGTKYIVNGPPFFIPLWFPTISHFDLRSVNRQIDKILISTIEKNENCKTNNNRFARILINEHSNDKSGRSDRRLMLDEMKTMLAGGYFPVACSLSVFWHVMGKNPDFFPKLYSEIRSKSKDYVFKEDFYKDFPETTSMIFETMRLYPVAFSIWRKSKVDQVIDDLFIPKGKTICISLFNIHRNPEIWNNPDKFQPERFKGKRLRERPKHHFMPFGWGNRKSIGDNYAIMVIYLTIIKIIQRYDIEVLKGQEMELKNAPLISPKELLARLKNSKN